MEKKTEDRGDAVFIEPPTIVKSKARAISSQLHTELLAKAEEAIKKMGGLYIQWVQKDLVALQETYATATAAPEEQLGSYFETILNIAHDIKGQGGSFDYFLLTAIAGKLCRLLERLADNQRYRHLEVVKVHIDAMSLVVDKNMTGDGGKAGERLLAGLAAAAIKKLTVEEKSLLKRSV